MAAYAGVTRLREVSSFFPRPDRLQSKPVYILRQTLNGSYGQNGLGSGIQFRSLPRSELERNSVRKLAPTNVIAHEREERAPTDIALESEPDDVAAYASAAEGPSRSAAESVNQESSVPPAPAVTGTHGELSARDRRKLRQEKRTATKEDREKVREEIEVVLTRRVKSAKKVPIEKQKDLSMLTGLGPQWYLVQIGTKGELAILDQIKKSVRNQFPDAEIEMFYPMVPAKVVTRGGGISSVPIKLTPGIAYMRTTLSNEMHSFLKGLDGVRGFYGKRVGHLEDFMVVPEAVKGSQVEDVLRRIEDETRDFEVWKVEVLRQKEEEASLRLSKFPSVGSWIRVVVNGSVYMCEGRVSKIDTNKWKLTAVVEVEGGSRVVHLGENEFEILQR